MFKCIFTVKCNFTSDKNKTLANASSGQLFYFLFQKFNFERNIPEKVSDVNMGMQH